MKSFDGPMVWYQPHTQNVCVSMIHLIYDMPISPQKKCSCTEHPVAGQDRRSLTTILVFLYTECMFTKSWRRGQIFVSLEKHFHGKTAKLVLRVVTSLPHTWTEIRLNPTSVYLGSKGAMRTPSSRASR